MRPPNNIQSLFGKADLKTKGEMDRKVLDEMLQAQKEAVRFDSAGTGPSIWRTIMKSKTARISSAAAVIIWPD